MKGLRKAVVLFCIVMIAAVSFAGYAGAQDVDKGKKAEGPLKIVMQGLEVKKVIEAGKVKETFKPLAEKVNPGAVIEYRIRAENTANEPLNSVILKGVCPKGTIYIADSASKNPHPEFSIDNGATYQKEPVKYKAKLPDGKEIEKTATPDMYTNIRWVIQKMKAKDKINLSYRVEVKKEEVKENVKK